MNISEFLHMGGYAFYVWTSYGLTLIVLIANVVWPLQRRKKIDKMLVRNLRREGGMQ